MNEIQKALMDLGYSTLADLISYETNTETDLNTVTKEIVLYTLNVIKKRWQRVPYSNREKYFKKLKVERICCGMCSFLQKYDIFDYLGFLKWMRTRDVLVDVTYWMKSVNTNAINKDKYNFIFDSICAIVESEEDAKSILDTYCKENKMLIVDNSEIDTNICTNISFEVSIESHSGLNLKLK